MNSNLYSARLAVSIAERKHMPLEEIRRELASRLVGAVLSKIEDTLPLESVPSSDLYTDLYESKIMVMTQQDYNRSIFDAEARGRQSEANDTDGVITKLTAELEKQAERMRKILSAVSNIITEDTDVVNNLINKLKDQRQNDYSGN